MTHRREAPAPTDAAVLAALAGLSDRAIAVLRPIRTGGELVDASLVWMSDRAKRMLPGVEQGSRFRDVISAAPEAGFTGEVVRAAAANPGVPIKGGPTDVFVDGERRRFEITVTLTADRELILVDHMDCTQALHDREAVLESDHHFKELLEGLDAGVVLLEPSFDAHGTIIDAEITWTNAESRSMWNNQDGLAPGTKVTDVYYDQADWFETANAAWKGVKATRLLRADPEVAPWSAATETIRRVGNVLVELTVDISDQERMMQRLASGERLETLGRTAGSIAHDFNNLLMIVAGNIERVQYQLREENLALSTASVATQRAAQLASSLLAFARGRPGVPAQVHLTQQVRSFEPILRGLAFPNATLQLDFADEVTVWADATHIEQIFLNLATNARDAIQDRGTITVEIATADHARCHLLDEPTHGPWATITVTDDGVGVAPEIADRVWESFFSAKTPRDDSGTGLGLSTVHGLAHQHGGHVVMDSTLGAGTSVTVYLPISTTPE